MFSVFKNKCSLTENQQFEKKVETIVKCKMISQKKIDNQMSKIIRTNEHLDTKKYSSRYIQYILQRLGCTIFFLLQEI